MKHILEYRLARTSLLWFIIGTAVANIATAQDRIDQSIMGAGATAGRSDEGTTVFGTLGQPLLLVVDDPDRDRFIRKRGLIDGFWSGVTIGDVPISGVDNTGINTAATIAIYPIPATNRAELRTTIVAPAVISIQVYDATGKLCWQSEPRLQETGEVVIPIDVQTLPAGINACVITIQQQEATHRSVTMLPVVR